MKNTYTGSRSTGTPTFSINGVRQTNPSGGFDWGYSGTSCARLAYSILKNEFGSAIAEAHHQDFKRDVVAFLDDVSWKLDADQVQDWFKGQPDYKPVSSVADETVPVDSFAAAWKSITDDAKAKGESWNTIRIIEPQTPPPPFRHYVPSPVSSTLKFRHFHGENRLALTFCIVDRGDYSYVGVAAPHPDDRGSKKAGRQLAQYRVFSVNDRFRILSSDLDFILESLTSLELQAGMGLYSWKKLGREYSRTLKTFTRD